MGIYSVSCHLVLVAGVTIRSEIMLNLNIIPSRVKYTCQCSTSLSFSLTYSDERLPDSKTRTERERKQTQVEVSRAQKWAEMINQENVKKYFGNKVR